MGLQQFTEQTIHQILMEIEDGTENRQVTWRGSKLLLVIFGQKHIYIYILDKALVKVTDPSYLEVPETQKPHNKIINHLYRLWSLHNRRGMVVALA